jgi:copper transport protein
VYLFLATAQFALRSALDVSALWPLLRASAFGRALVDLELVLALLAGAATIAVLLDRPERSRRSIVELLATGSALAAAAAVLLVPGLSGHPAQTSPAGLLLPLDWIHLAAGSLWIAGLLGLLLVTAFAGSGLRVAALARVVPRFSAVALPSVVLLIASGTIAAAEHLPTLSSLWQKSYGQAILVKAGLVAVALVPASINRLHVKPQLVAAARDGAQRGGSGAVSMLRGTATLEAVVVACAVVAAATLTSLAPPSPALAKEGQASAHVGPGQVAKVVHHGDYTLAIAVDPNRAALPNRFSVKLARGGRPVRGATVIAQFDMLDMDMPSQSYVLEEVAPGLYRRDSSALVMVGHWGVTYQIQPPGGGAPFSVVVVDKAEG